MAPVVFTDEFLNAAHEVMWPRGMGHADAAISRLYVLKTPFLLQSLRLHWSLSGDPACVSTPYGLARFT